MAQTLTYVLRPGSSIATTCRDCNPLPGPPQVLTGSFDLTPRPVDGRLGVAAITNVHFTAPNLTIGVTKAGEIARVDFAPR